MNLTKCKIKDLGTVLTGNTPPTSQRKYYGNLYPLIKPTDMKIDERYIGHTQESLSEEGYKLFENKLLPKNTPCVVTIGTIGKLCLTKEPSFCNQAVNSIIVDQRLHNPIYIFYLMKISIPKVKFLSSGTASGRENVSKSAFEVIEVEVPPLSVQQKIASILSNYDDLIENNTRRIEILEQMAKLVYEEWFVKFRFLGHENVKMVSSELGEIPEGWKIREVSEILKRLKAGKKYTQDNVLEEGLVPVIDQSEKEVLGFHNTTADHNASLKDPIMIFGDHTCKIKILIEPFSIGPNVVPFVSKSYPETFVFFLIRNLVQTKEYKRHWNELQAKKVVLSDVALTKDFVNVVNPLFQQIILLEHKNQNLRKTRNLLLPKLISGEIDVSDLDISIRNEYQERNFNFEKPQDEKGLRFKMV